MASTYVKFHGTLPKINPDFLRCIIIYLVRGPDVLASIDVGEESENSSSPSRGTSPSPAAARDCRLLSARPAWENI